MSLALYIMSAATSMRRIRYMSLYMESSSAMLVSTMLLGPSILWVLNGSTWRGCVAAVVRPRRERAGVGAAGPG